MKTRGWLAVLWMVQLVGCGGGSPGSASAADAGTPFAGTWACNLASGGASGPTALYNGEAVEIDPYTDPNAGSIFFVSAKTPWDLGNWFCTPFVMQGSRANLYGLTACDGPLYMTRGQVVVSADSSTMTIGEVGTANGTEEIMAGTCVRPGPPPPPSTPSGSSSSGGSSGGQSPECYGDWECGDCGQCWSGRCYACPVGSLGICTC
jgi:hypothetical protein